MDRDRVEAHLRNLERLIDDPPPLLTLVVRANGTGVMVAHPMLLNAQATPEQAEAALRLVRVQLVEVAGHLEVLIERNIRAAARDMTNAVDLP